MDQDAGMGDKLQVNSLVSTPRVSPLGVLVALWGNKLMANDISKRNASALLHAMQDGLDLLKSDWGLGLVQGHRLQVGVMVVSLLIFLEFMLHLKGVELVGVCIFKIEVND